MTVLDAKGLPTNDCDPTQSDENDFWRKNTEKIILNIH